VFYERNKEMRERERKREREREREMSSFVKRPIFTT
jgi:hypothetical protein